MSVPMPPLPAGFGKMESVFLSKHAVRARDAAVARAALGEAARRLRTDLVSVTAAPEYQAIANAAAEMVEAMAKEIK